MAGGQNDHPATGTFLQLYKLLSMYSALKPPKYGNCTVSEQPRETLLSIEGREICAMKKTHILMQMPCKN